MSLFRRITGFSTPVCGLQWQPPAESLSIPKFEGVVAITGDENTAVIEFLEANVGNIVFIDCVIDACLATSRHYEVVEQENVDLHAITRGELSGRRFPLLNSSKLLRFLEVALLPTHPVNVSFGGTGVIQTSLQGFFDVSATAHGGPTIVFYLAERAASVELMLKVRPNKPRSTPDDSRRR